MKDNHAEIYLQPPGTSEDPDTGRLWCQDDAPFDCENDDGDVVPWVKYVRADIHDALAARLAEFTRLAQEVATISSEADISNCIDEARRLVDVAFLRPAASAPGEP